MPQVSKQGDKNEAYDDYSVYGGLPAVALMTTEEQKTNYLISQMKNVYLRDIIIRYSIHGMTTCDATVDRYIGFAEEAFMLTRVKRYSVKSS
ncbi:MAG: hypothetical protein Q4F06_02285 [Eubacteriales bacterium]|nr:hypothetical protein [Eubacteriales bacterium]